MKNGSDLSRTVAGILKASEGTDTKRLIEQTELANAMTKRQQRDFMFLYHFMKGAERVIEKLREKEHTQ